MKTRFDKIRSHVMCAAVIFLICPLLLMGCQGYYITIKSPDDDSTFTQGDTVTFSMELASKSMNPENPDVTIGKGTLIQWTSNIDGELYADEIDQDIPATGQPDGDYYASYTHQFSSAGLSPGNHTISCIASKMRSRAGALAHADILVHIISRGTTTTTSQGPDTTTTTKPGDLTPAECDAIHRIEVYAGEPEYYGPDCYAKIYVNNKSDQHINVISCQYDTHVASINGCKCWVFSPRVNDYIIDSGWISATQTDGSTRTRRTTIVAATYSVEGCAWICNELADRTLDTPLSTIDVESMNPCAGSST